MTFAGCRTKIVDLLQKVILILFGLLLGIVGVEILGRIVNDTLPYPIQYSMQMGSLARSDPDFGITIVPGEIEVKSAEFSHPVSTRDLGCPNYAFRDDGLDDRPTRILALGDSFTWGAGVADEQTWPAVLEAQLPAEVINAGYPGIGTQQELLLLQHCGQFLKPDMVIVAFFVNDFVDNLVWRQRLGIDSYWYSTLARPLRVWLAAHSYSYQFFKYFILGPLGSGDFQNLYWSEEELARRYLAVAQDGLALHLSRDYALYLTPEYHIYAQAIPAVEQALVAMQQEAAALDSRFLVVVLPAKEQVYWRYLQPTLPAQTAYRVDLPAEIVRTIGQDNQMTVLDLYPVFAAHSRQQLYWDVDGHMNAAGYELIADSIAEFLSERKWLD